MEQQFYVGIDLDDENAIISFFQQNMKEPETVSTVAGSEVFQIPLWLTKKKGIGQWFIGEEARRLASEQGELGADRYQGTVRFLSKAIKGERIFVEGEEYPASDLLALYLRKLMLLAGSLGKPAVPDRLVITLDQLSRESSSLFSELAPKLGLEPEQIMLIDRKESFYYFACHQTEELMLHDVYLFDYRGEEISCCRLERNLRTKPQLITMTEEMRHMDGGHADEAFLQILTECFRGHVVSAAYLIGDGFEGGWMKQSVSFLCRGRRAFIGKNLYSKGACYAAAVRAHPETWSYVYMGENEMKVNVCLKVLRRGEQEFFTLIRAGDNWYEAVGECEVILAGTPEISFWLQLPNSREAKIEKLTLADLPERPERATRLRIYAKPQSDHEVWVQIRDLGFGELFCSSDKTWTYVLSL